MDEDSVWHLYGVPAVDEPPEPQWSGLYDDKGRPLYRRPEPVGFAIPKPKKPGA